MGYWSDDDIMTDKSLRKKLKRELNLKSIMEDCDFKPNLNNLVSYTKHKKIKRQKVWGLPIGKKYEESNVYKDSALYNKIKMLSEKYDFILTGSAALRIFGVLNRKPKEDDIDIIATKETVEKMSKELDEYVYTTYGSIEQPDLNLEKSFQFSGAVIDVFLNEDTNYIEIDGIRVSEPFDIMFNKIKMSRHKDIKDIKYFLNYIN